ETAMSHPDPIRDCHHAFRAATSAFATKHMKEIYSAASDGGRQINVRLWLNLAICPKARQSAPAQAQLSVTMGANSQSLSTKLAYRTACCKHPVQQIPQSQHKA